MRTRLLLASFFLPVLAFAAEQPPPNKDQVGVSIVTIDLEGVGADVTVGGASMSRGWLLSWAHSADVRDVTLQPVGLDGRAGTETKYRDCTVTSFSGFAKKRSADVVDSLKIRCAN